MKIAKVINVISEGSFPFSNTLKQIQEEIYHGIDAVKWPLGNDSFSIYPKRKGNGVKPIKNDMMKHLVSCKWEKEIALDITTNTKPGKLDAIKRTKHGIYALEWETGNISSSHRALNKICVGILLNKLIGGTLIVPSAKLYPYLTDRIGNFPELEPYLPLWSSIKCLNGFLQIIVVEQDGISKEVPLIPKGTDGRALR